MDNKIPFEIFEQILNNVVEHTHPSTERFPMLTPASKQGILSAREVWGNCRREKPLRQLYITVLEETVFIMSSQDDERGRISGLEALSRSDYANDITTLNFCPMVCNGGISTAAWANGYGRDSVYCDQPLLIT